MTAPVLYLDRDGDVWRVGGHTRTGEELLACDSPSGLDDIGGQGPTHFPWTRRTVEDWFGPLVRIEPRPAALVPTTVQLGRELVAA